MRNSFIEIKLNLNRLREYGRVYGFGNQFGRNLAWSALVEDLQADKFLADDFATLKSIESIDVEENIKNNY